MKWKILLPIIILLLISFIIGVFFHLQRAMEEAEQANNIILPPIEENIEKPEKTEEVSFPEPTDNIDDTAEALVDSLSNEESLIQDEKEAEAIDSESQAISDFGDSYDESEF